MDLGGNQIGAEGARALAEALKINATLTSMDLGGNQIGAEGARALAEALKANMTLICMALADNEIGNEGAKALADALSVNTTLLSMNLACNPIGVEGAKTLADALKGNMVLTFCGLHGDGFSAVAAYVGRNIACAPLVKYLNSLRSPLSSGLDKPVIEDDLQVLPIDERMLICLFESSSPRVQALAKLALAHALRHLALHIGLKDEEVTASLEIILIKMLEKKTHPEVGYLWECSRLLSGLRHMGASLVGETMDMALSEEMEARSYLLPTFADASLQSIANIALGQLLSLLFARHLKNAPPEQQIAQRQLVLHCLRDQQKDEFLSPFVFGALWRLQNRDKKERFDDIRSLREDALLLSYSEIHAFAKKALASLDKSDEKITCEIDFLTLVVEEESHRPGLVKYVSKSPAFTRELGTVHGKKNSLVCLEDCLVLTVTDDPHLLSPLSEIPISAEDVKDLCQVSKPASPLIDKLLAIIRAQVAAIAPVPPKPEPAPSLCNPGVQHGIFATPNSVDIVKQSTPSTDVKKTP